MWCLYWQSLFQQAIQAVHRYNESKGLKPAEEVERLRLDTESLMAAVQEYQLRMLAGPVQTLH
ncbi:hypothetical protein BK663_19475 [Pseudomonas lini]|uniref:Uncharacterized protein n=1 Tax=Pseudomonas lini TaxID=163011 RepID=A0A423IJL3_9PSED|nr:hypothetical protein BK663_19475 [Pseudomonas lini]